MKADGAAGAVLGAVAAEDGDCQTAMHVTGSGLEELEIGSETGGVREGRGTIAETGTGGGTAARWTVLLWRQHTCVCR